MDALRIIVHHLEELGFAAEFCVNDWILGGNLYQIRTWANGHWDRLVTKNLYGQITTIAKTYGSEFDTAEISIVIPSLSIPGWDIQNFINLHHPNSLEHITEIVTRKVVPFPLEDR